VFVDYRQEIWSALQREMGQNGPWDGRPVRIHHPPFVVTADVNANLAGYASDVVTRLRAAFMNPEELRFRFVRQAWKERMAKLVGVHDVEVGEKEFDSAFWIRANDTAALRQLLAGPSTRKALLDSPVSLAEVRDDEGWFGPEYPEGVDELVLEAPGRVTDQAAVGAMYAAMAEILDALARRSAAYRK